MVTTCCIGITTALLFQNESSEVPEVSNSSPSKSLKNKIVFESEDEETIEPKNHRKKREGKREKENEKEKETHRKKRISLSLSRNKNISVGTFL